MPKVPEIQYSDITISEQYINEFNHDRCANGLWSIYNVIKKIIFNCNDDTDYKRVLECLYMIGANGTFEDHDSSLLVYRGRTNKKYRRNMPAAKYLFQLEKYGFVFDILTSDTDTPGKNLAIRDITQLKLSYHDNGFSNVIFGLKFFSDICVEQSGDCFYTGDIRVAFAGMPRLYAPPVEEIFYFLPDDQKKLAYAVHNKLDELQCLRNLEREYMMRYMHPKKRAQTFATIYAAEHLWFLPDSEIRQKLSFKLNLRNIGEYADYLYQCTEAIQQAVIDTPDCYGCKKACGGIAFAYKGKTYTKCAWYIFRFGDLSEKAGANYIRLIELENEFLSQR